MPISNQFRSLCLPSHPDALVTTGWNFVLINLSILNFSYRWSQTLGSLLWLTGFTFSRFIRFVAYISTSFLFITKSSSIKWMCHTLFVHHLIMVGCFSLCLLYIMLLWAFMCSFCVNACFHFSHRSGIVGSHGNSMLNYLWRWQATFQSGCIIWDPHQQGVRAEFLHILPMLVTACPFDGSYSECVVVSPCGCDLQLLGHVGHFSYAYWLCVHLPWGYVCSNPGPFLSWIAFLLLSCKSSFPSLKIHDL